MAVVSVHRVGWLAGGLRSGPRADGWIACYRPPMHLDWYAGEIVLALLQHLAGACITAGSCFSAPWR